MKTLRNLALISLAVALAATPLPALGKEYVIGVADVVAISVLDNRDLDAVVTVTPGGKIALSLVGEIQAAGLTAIGKLAPA